MSDAARPNRLAAEASPYLQQHAHNPVDWYPWGEEALERAAQEDKPILLSIGYAACHWCHVMERESFDDASIAAYMNQHFVSIKVDREERPDLDQIYQTAAQVTIRQGGWPLTVFLTPDLKPFFVGTYFPQEPRFGRPGFLQVLQGVVQAYRSRRHDVAGTADRITGAIRRLDEDEGLPGRTVADDPERKRRETEQLLRAAGERLQGDYDASHGGFGGAPKFPPHTELDLLLRLHRLTGEELWLEMVTQTLRQLAGGGIHDQLGGGFHRYSVDRVWLVPHFEKMLYDNALLPPLFLRAYQLTGDEEFARIARETFAFVARDLTHPAGAFFSAWDADSEGEEGRYYVWRPEEVRAVLDSDAAELILSYYGITDEGNFEDGATVLSVQLELDALSRRLGEPEAALKRRLAEARRLLLAARQEREPPLCDDKVLTAWNGLMIRALALGGRILDDSTALAAATRAAAFIERELVDGNRLYRRWRDGDRAVPGFLDDYVFYAWGRFSLYEATFAREHLAAARRWLQRARELFYDAEQGRLYYAEASDELVHRPRDTFDNPVPASTAACVYLWLRLFHITGDEELAEAADRVLAAHRRGLARLARGRASFLSALAFQHSRPLELLIAAPGGSDHPEAAAWLRRLAGSYRPDLVLSCIDPQERDPDDPDRPALWQAAAAVDEARAYVCRDFSCSLPATSWAELVQALTGDEAT